MNYFNKSIEGLYNIIYKEPLKTQIKDLNCNTHAFLHIENLQYCPDEKNILKNTYRENTINFMLYNFFELSSEINFSNVRNISGHNHQCTLFQYQDYIDFCTHDDIIRDKNHVLIGFFAPSQQTSFSFLINKKTYTYELKKGDFVFALDNQGIIPMISCIYTTMKLRRFVNPDSLKLIYATISSSEVNKKLEYKTIIIANRHKFESGIYSTINNINDENIINIPDMKNMWTNKKYEIEKRMNIIKKELIKKVTKRNIEKMFNKMKLEKPVYNILFNNYVFLFKPKLLTPKMM